MDEVKDRRQRKILIGVIVVLCVIAVGLGVGIGVKVANGGDDEQIADEETSDSGLELSEREKMQVYFDDDMEELSAKVDEILVQNPNNGSAAKKIYTDYVDKYMLYGMKDFASYCAQEGADKLSSVGLKEQALELLLLADLEQFMNSGKCMLISDIISLATELNKEEILSKYEQLAAITDDGFGEMCNVSSTLVSLYDYTIEERIDL